MANIHALYEEFLIEMVRRDRELKRREFEAVERVFIDFPTEVDLKAEERQEEDLYERAEFLANRRNAYDNDC